MKKKIIIIVLLAALLFTFGCSPKKESGFATAEFARATGLAYDDSEWGGAGFSETTVDLEGQTSSAFRNMSNLYGRASQAASVSDAANPNPSDSYSADLSNVERKLVKSADIRIRVENLEAANASLVELLKKYDAYSASTNIEENYYYYTLRVPSYVYDIFLAEMSGMGRQLRRSESTEDVTLRYYDLEGRLATKKELLKTYQSYLGRAKNIEEVLSVEARIADLQSDIEGTGMQLRNLANRIDYATITLQLYGPVSSTPNKNETFGERFREMFGNFGQFLSGMLFVIIGIVIYGVPILLLVALLFLLLFGRIGVIKKLWRIVTPAKHKQ